MYYYVQPGDSLHGIAVQYDTTVSHLMDLNPQIRNPHRLYVGERIKVSSGDYWGRRWEREHRRGYEHYTRNRHTEHHHGR